MSEHETKGHSAAQGGLRAHSMGDTYPWLVIGLNEGYALLNVLTGEQGPEQETYALAARGVQSKAQADKLRFDLLMKGSA